MSDRLPEGGRSRLGRATWQPGGALALMAVMSLSGCATQQDVQPQLKAADPARLGVHATLPYEVGEHGIAWWQPYGDTQLDALMAQALAGNPGLMVAQTRLRRVQALETFSRAGDMPQVQATGQVDRQRLTEHGMYPRPLAGSTLTIGTLQLEGSWEWDLFGRQRAELEAAIGQARAAQADVQATRLLLSAQVGRTYVQLGRLQALRELAQRTLAQREGMLALVRQRVHAGLDTQVELRLSESALPDARTQIEALDEQIAHARHALAALSGQAPDVLDDLVVPLSRLRPLPSPQAMPLDLLARRADVVAALWRVQAAGHQVDAARALFYPNVDLRAYSGFNAIGLAQLLEAGSFQWGLLPAIHLPLFDADRRRANLQGKVADEDTATATYNQTILTAVQEVADQLSSGQSIERQQAHQQQAQDSAEQAYSLARERYQAGLSTYLVVLQAESAVLNQRRLAVDLQARAIDAQLGLIKAMGGDLRPGLMATNLAAATPHTGMPSQHALQTGSPS